MHSVAILLVCLSLCQGHAVLPVLPSAHWGVHAAPIALAPYPSVQHGLDGHGYVEPLLHHVWKRSPHLVSPVAHVAPVAVSHQYRHDVHSSVVPVVKQVIVPATPLLQKLVHPLPYAHELQYGYLHPHHYWKLCAPSRFGSVNENHQ